MTLRRPKLLTVNGVLYWGLLALYVFGSSRGVLWLLRDVSVRLDPSRSARLPQDYVQFVESVSWGQQAVFAISMVFMWGASIAMLRQSRWALHFQGAAFFAYAVDWILSANAGYDMFKTSGAIGLIAMLIAAGVLIILIVRGELYRKAF
ncbi:hypothetical protein RMQ97_05135 [Maricaulis sp. D1M11]|uniref:hypothetical protein n=1 Tax=Maricaulis sp. D1M11 TaxID=3076117 RepID=UPI0039B59FC4